MPHVGLLGQVAGPGLLPLGFMLTLVLDPDFGPFQEVMC